MSHRLKVDAGRGMRQHSSKSIATLQSRRNILLTGVTFLTTMSEAGRCAHADSSFLDLPGCSNFKQSSKGIQWCDRQQGTGFEPLPGDVVVVDYTARATTTSKVYDGSRNFKFGLGNDEVIPGWEAVILGEDGIPPIKQGGTRTAIIPPELAYGNKGDGCLYGLSTACRVPPDSPVEITFKLKGATY